MKRSLLLTLVLTTIAGCDDNDNEESAAHPLCDVHFVERDDESRFVTLRERETCFSAGDAEGLECFLSGVASGEVTSLELDLQVGDNPSSSRGRVLLVDGDLSLDQRTGFEGGTSSWEEVRVVPTPNLSMCSDEANADGMIACIQQAFDEASATERCFQSGTYFFPE